MPTEENQVTLNPTNWSGSSQFNPGSTQSDDQSTNQNISWENQQIDTLDIDLNLDGLDLPVEKNQDLFMSDSWDDSQKVGNLDLWNIDVGPSDNLDQQENELNVNEDKFDEIQSDFNFVDNKDISENEVKSDSQENNLVEDQNNSLEDENVIQDVNIQDDFSNNLDKSDDNLTWNSVDLSSINQDNFSKDSQQIDFSDINLENKNNELIPDQVVVENDNVEQESDWLLEEDKKVEEILPKEENVFEENVLPKDSSLLSDDDKLSSLDLPFVSSESRDSENLLDQNIEVDQKVDDLSDLFSEEESVQKNEPKIEITTEELNQNINVPNENITENNIQENNSIEWNNNTEVIQNTNEPVVKNDQGDLVSDTWDMVTGDVNYIPNENEFMQVQNILNSDKKWEIDISSLENSVNSNKLDLWELAENISDNNPNNWINVDEIISWSNNGINIEDIIKSTQVEPIIIKQDENNIRESQTSLPQTSDVVTPIEQMNNNTAQQWNDMTAQVVDVAQNVGLNMNLQNTPNNVQVISSSEFLKKKNSHSGIKIFVLIVLLLVGWFMIISKMYPEEIKEIMNAIKNGNQASIEYSDNSELSVALDETWSVLTGDLYEEDEIDPNSLAWQLEMENVLSGDLEVSLDETTALDWQTGHGAADFNAFEDLDNVLGNNGVSSLNADLLKNLKWYLDKWNEFNNWWRQNNNSTAMKYWLYIANYAEQFINDIESGKEIDKSKLDEFIIRFDSYIERLNNLRNEQNVLNSAESILQDGILNNGVEQTGDHTWTEF